jgi:hypothetical protein
VDGGKWREGDVECRHLDSGEVDRWKVDFWIAGMWTSE